MINLNYDKQFQHCPDKEYKDFLLKYYSKGTIDNYMSNLKSFKNLYPNIEMWFKEDLSERIGNIHENKNYSYNNRMYLFYLVINGYITLDYDYLFSLHGTDGFVSLIKKYNYDYGFEELKNIALTLGYSELTINSILKWGYYRVVLHTGIKHYKELTIEDLKEYDTAISKYEIKNFEIQYPNKLVKFSKDVATQSLYLLHHILYNDNSIKIPAQKKNSKSIKVDRELKYLKHKSIREVIVRYCKIIANTCEKITTDRKFSALRTLAEWLEDKYENVDKFSKLQRFHIEDFIQYINEYISKRTGKKLSQNSKVNIIVYLKVFFEDVIEWQWSDVPSRPLVFNSDIPKRPDSLPRYIPQEHLDKLMKAIKQLDDVYQKNALLILRWSGGRREEIRRLEVNCVDYYDDGTPKLYIPLGKTNTSRWIPIHEEAHEAIKELQELRKTAGNLKGEIDRKTGKTTDYLFMRKGKQISMCHLFQDSLVKACNIAGLIDGEGKPLYTSHQFRHTIGTEMANKGAKIQTIMKMLGHKSPAMTLTYAKISDKSVKEDYEKVIGSNAIIAGGEYANIIKNHDLKQDEINWIQNNFLKTYVSLGHCLRHPMEGECPNADICLFCAKFVATIEDTPKLEDKLDTELKILEDAKQKGWQREFERHQNVINRVKAILKELGKEI